MKLFVFVFEFVFWVSVSSNELTNTDKTSWNTVFCGTSAKFLNQFFANTWPMKNEVYMYCQNQKMSISLSWQKGKIPNLSWKTFLVYLII